MAELTLEQASIIVDATLAKGAEMKLRPLTVSVVDSGGNLKAVIASHAAIRADASAELTGGLVGALASGVAAGSFDPCISASVYTPNANSSARLRVCCKSCCSAGSSRS